MYTIPVNLPSQTEAERLYLLIEECSEVQKQACKILRFGYNDIHPNTKIDNKTILHEELGDLHAVIDLMKSKYDIFGNEILKQVPIKYEKMKKFTLFQNF